MCHKQQIEHEHLQKQKNIKDKDKVDKKLKY